MSESITRIFYRRISQLNNVLYPYKEKILLAEDINPNTPIGRLERQPKKEPYKPSPCEKKNDHYAPFPNATNPLTGEIGGPSGPEPTRFGDWERKGRVSDF